MSCQEVDRESDREVDGEIDRESSWLTTPDAASAKAPSARLTGREWRMGLEMASAVLRRKEITSWPTGDGHPVLVLPGFLAGPESTIFLRSALRQLGYRVHDWAQGRNLGLHEGLEEAMMERLYHVHDRYGQPVSLIGWSAGGIYARELTRRDPHVVRDVITMGSPFRGHLEATRAWRLYRFMNRGDLSAALVTQEARLARAQPLPVPTTCIYSVKDGVVPWECCTSLPAPHTENIEVDATHLGYGHHLPTLRIIADRLAQPAGQWAPYTANGADPRPGESLTGPDRPGGEDEQAG